MGRACDPHYYSVTLIRLHIDHWHAILLSSFSADEGQYRMVWIHTVLAYSSHLKFISGNEGQYWMVWIHTMLAYSSRFSWATKMIGCLQCLSTRWFPISLVNSAIFILSVVFPCFPCLLPTAHRQRHYFFSVTSLGCCHLKRGNIWLWPDRGTAVAFFYSTNLWCHRRLLVPIISWAGKGRASVSQEDDLRPCWKRWSDKWRSCELIPCR